ncbi:NAD(P)H-hydrate dehydratase [Facklamia hominis]|uniref:NAD(P)H-hydrate dehydratase n=1 Tax=Facklamia hominis TaxID=178214 RepID=UPI00101D7BD2|nr:NAD(P)H-hydrate dehydratase [Facklamia hominis]RYC97487.1 NAD(P)H-hydrate dehydratase [Facklamia hominis]
MEEVTEEWVSTLLKERSKTAYKNQFGHNLLIAGNQAMAGAALIASRACVYVGSGLTSLLTHPANVSIIHQALPEAMVDSWKAVNTHEDLLQKTQHWLIGPGMGQDTESRSLFIHLMEQARVDQVVILDADGLNLWCQNPQLTTKAQLILTPHFGEWQRLKRAFDIQDSRTWAKESGIHLVLKGAPTVMIDRQGKAYQNIAGNPGMAIGGMGDCLAGMMLGFLGQVSDPFEAVVLACYLHTAVANSLYQDQYIVLPSRLIDQIPYAMKRLFSKKEAAS